MFIIIGYLCISLLLILFSLGAKWDSMSADLEEINDKVDEITPNSGASE